MKYAGVAMSLESPGHRAKGSFHVVEQAAPCSRAESRDRPGGSGDPHRALFGGGGNRARSRRHLCDLPRRVVPCGGDADRSGHDGARDRTPHRPHPRPRRQRLRRAGVLRLGDRHRVQGRLHAERRQVDRHTDHDCVVQDQDPGTATRERRALQRDGDRRVDERVGRGIGARLGLPQPDADERRLCVRRRVGAGAGRRGRQGAPRLVRRSRTRHRGTGTLRNAPPPR